MGSKSGSNRPKMGPVDIFRNSRVIWAYMILLMPCMLIEVNMNYDSVKTTSWKTWRFSIYKSKIAKNGQKWDLSWYISKCRDQSVMLFRIENGVNSGLVLRKTVWVQIFSILSYSMAKRSKKLIFQFFRPYVILRIT